MFYVIHNARTRSQEYVIERENKQKIKLKKKEIFSYNW